MAKKQKSSTDKGKGKSSCPETGEKCGTPIVCGGLGCVREQSKALTRPGTTGTLKPGTSRY